MHLSMVTFLKPLFDKYIYVCSKIPKASCVSCYAGDGRLSWNINKLVVILRCVQ